MRKKQNDFSLPMSEKIEMVAVNKKTGKSFLKIISYEEALNVKKNRNFFYYYYQIGFSQFNLSNK